MTDIEAAILNLEEIARLHPDRSQPIGYALGVLRHYRDHGLSKTDRVTDLPDTTESFGSFIMFDCDEADNPIEALRDEDGEPLTFLPYSKVVEQPRKG